MTSFSSPTDSGINEPMSGHSSPNRSLEAIESKSEDIDDFEVIVLFDNICKMSQMSMLIELIAISSIIAYRLVIWYSFYCLINESINGCFT